jgi:hypothetical protein
MQILTFPGLTPNFDPSGTEDLVQARQGGLLLVRFAHQSKEKIPDYLVHRCVPVESHLPRGTQEIVIQNQS